MKVLIIIDDLLSAGTENVLANRIRALYGDVKFSVVTLYDRGKIAEIIENKGVDVNFIDLKKMGYLKSIKYVKKIAKRERPDLIICMRDVSRAVFPIFLKNIAPIVMFWDNPIIKRSFKQSLLELLQMSLFSPHIYTSSKVIANAIESRYGTRDITVIPNTFDDIKFYPLIKKEISSKDGNNFSKELPKDDNNLQSPNVIKIISVGNMREEKQHIEKFLIAKELKARGIKFKLDIVGAGAFCELRNLINKFQLNNEISFLGGCDNVPELLRESHLFLLTSQSEGSPVALLEAMASGLASIVYQFPGLEEIDKSFSYIDVVPQKNINDVVERIIFYQKNSKERIEFGQRASKYVIDNFSTKQNAKKWKEYLLSLIPTV